MEPKQAVLELPFPELGGDQPPIPARMLNEHVYCPRRASASLKPVITDIFVCVLAVLRGFVRRHH